MNLVLHWMNFCSSDANERRRPLHHLPLPGEVASAKLNIFELKMAALFNGTGNLTHHYLQSIHFYPWCGLKRGENTAWLVRIFIFVLKIN